MPLLTPLILFQALADETRLALILLMRDKGELCVCELSAILQKSQPKTSRHLAVLKKIGILHDRREGKWIHYRLSPQMPAWVAAVIEQAYLCQRDALLQMTRQAERDNATTNGKPICI